MKNDELNKADIKRLRRLVKAEIQQRRLNVSLEGLFDLETKLNKWNTRTEQKEQDVCPECGDTGKKFNDFGLPDKDCPSCKAPVDKIREDFDKIDYDFIGPLPEQFAFQWFSEGYKSRQAE